MSVIQTFCYRCFGRMKYGLRPDFYEMPPYLFGYVPIHGEKIFYNSHYVCPQPVFITIEIK